MSTDKTINQYIRRRLRELRKRKHLTVQEIASGAGIPVSSYCCMEGGYYNISLDHLFRILGVLDVDVMEVWPTETGAEAVADSPGCLRRIQEFRIAEIVSLTGSEGAALFSLYQRKCRVLVYHRLSDFLLDRLCLYIEDGRQYGEGFWFMKRRGQTTFVFFLKGESCPDYVKRLIDHYLVIWSNVFSRPLP